MIRVEGGRFEQKVGKGGLSGHEGKISVVVLKAEGIRVCESQDGSRYILTTKCVMGWGNHVLSFWSVLVARQVFSPCPQRRIEAVI